MGEPTETVRATPFSAPETTGNRSRWTRATHSGVWSLLALHSLLLGWLAVVYSPTRDEPAHLAAGYRIWATGKVDLYTVNPPLVKTVATWPLLFYRPKTDWSYVDGKQTGDRPEFITGKRFLEENPHIWPRMLIRARWACIPLSLMGALVAFQWARDVFGNTSGWLALLLWTFDPNLLGNGCLITPDLGGSSLGLTAGYLFWRWLIHPRWQRSLLAGLALGLALLCKSTLLIYGPLWVLWWAVQRWQGDSPRQTIRKDIAQLTVMLLLSGYVLNLGYGFAGTGTPLGKLAFVSTTLGGERTSGQLTSNRFQGTGWGAIPSPVPREFLCGLDLQKRDFEDGRWSYLAGHWKHGGWPYFYLIALAVKTPVAYGVLLVLSLIALRHSQRSTQQAAWGMGMCLLGVLGFVSREQGFTTSVRYVLPALPFAIVLLAGAGSSSATRNRWSVALLGLSLTWVVGGSLWCWPYSLSYFNELVGGPGGGYRVLLDSNVDWGQDLYFIKDWVNRHPEAKPVTLAWEESFNPELAGVNLRRTPSPADPESPQSAPLNPSRYVGWHIVCVNQLERVDGRFRYLSCQTPVDRIGYSTMVYCIDGQLSQSIASEPSDPRIR